MVQPGDAVGLRGAARRLPGIEAKVMVIAARGQEQDVAGRAPAGHVTGLEDDVEAEHADVEVAHAVDVRRAQVDVADPDTRGRSGGERPRGGRRGPDAAGLKGCSLPAPFRSGRGAVSPKPAGPASGGTGHVTPMSFRRAVGLPGDGGGATRSAAKHHEEEDRCPARSCTSRSRRTTPRKGREFWGSLFGWQFESYPGPSEYHMTRIGESSGAAITDMEPGKRGTRGVLRRRRHQRRRRAREGARRRGRRADAGAGDGLVLDLHGPAGKRVRALAERPVGGDADWLARCRGDRRPLHPGGRRAPGDTVARTW